jgi:mono/diheme cytochrome c family protein
MRSRIVLIRTAILAAVLAVASALWAAPAGGKSAGHEPSASAPNNDDPAAMRVEGEKRFRANCGRCHAAPHKFPPRMMATIVRHMRVRATITDEDMRLVLYYMTQ